MMSQKSRGRSKQAVRASGERYQVHPHGSRTFAIMDTQERRLVAVTVYLIGAAEVVRRLELAKC